MTQEASPPFFGAAGRGTCESGLRSLTNCVRGTRAIDLWKRWVNRQTIHFRLSPSRCLSTCKHSGKSVWKRGEFESISRLFSPIPAVEAGTNVPARRFSFR
jgi:hypothetical protein